MCGRTLKAEATSGSRPKIPGANTPPEWPELTFTELLQIAFQRTGCFVDSFDHDVFKKLKAEL